MVIRGRLHVKKNASIDRRLFIAFSDIAILVAIKNQAMTGYGVNKYLVRKVGDIASLTTIYGTIAMLEREGLIKCLRTSSGRMYGITEAGKKRIQECSNFPEESKRFVRKLLAEKSIIY